MYSVARPTDKGFNLKMLLYQRNLRRKNQFPTSNNNKEINLWPI